MAVKDERPSASEVRVEDRLLRLERSSRISLVLNLLALSAIALSVGKVWWQQELVLRSDKGRAVLSSSSLKFFSPGLTDSPGTYPGTLPSVTVSAEGNVPAVHLISPVPRDDVNMQDDWAEEIALQVGLGVIVTSQGRRARLSCEELAIRRWKGDVLDEAVGIEADGMYLHTPAGWRTWP